MWGLAGGFWVLFEKLMADAPYRDLAAVGASARGFWVLFEKLMADAPYYLILLAEDLLSFVE